MFAIQLPKTPASPSSQEKRYHSLPSRNKGQEDKVLHSFIPKSQTTTASGASPSKIFSKVKVSPIFGIVDLAKDSPIFDEKNPLIPSLKKHIFKVNDENEIRKLALFFAHYLKTCHMTEILAHINDIQSINEKCHSKMEHVPFETRLKIRFKEFYAKEIIRLFKSSLERNLVIYEKYCLAYQWFTDFQFIAHAFIENLKVIAPENYPIVAKFLIKLALYSDLKDDEFRKYFDPVIKILLEKSDTPKETHLIDAIVRLHSLKDIRNKNVSETTLKVLEIEPKPLNLKHEMLKDAPLQAIAMNSKSNQILSWSQILHNVRKKGSNKDIAELIAHDLKIISASYIKEVSLSNFCHLNRGHNWISKLQKHWNAVSNFAKKTIEDSKKKGKDTPKKSVTEFIIDIAHFSFEIHDFQTASALTLGIDSCKKLPKISKESKSKLETLLHKFNLSFNNEALRNEIKALEKRNLIYVPYLPLISKEIEMIHHGNPDVIEGKINEEKIKLLNRLFERFLNIQSHITERKAARTDILFEIRDQE